MSKDPLSHRCLMKAHLIYGDYAWTQYDEEFRVFMVLEPKMGGDPLGSLDTHDGAGKLFENHILSKWFAHSPLSRIYHYTHNDPVDDLPTSAGLKAIS